MRSMQSDVYKHIADIIATNPKKALRRVRLIVFLGYVYFAGTVLLGIACLVAAIWLYAAEHTLGCLVPLLVAAATLPLIRAFPYRFAEPEGVVVTKAQVPLLYAMVESVAQELNIPAPSYILITENFNAFAAKRAGNNLLPHRRKYDYIGLGLPLMLGCTPEQIRCTVAHELGHLRANDGLTSQAAHQVLTLWREVLQRSSRRRLAQIHLPGFVTFYQWYYPLLSAYMVSIARRGEYDADTVSLQIYGSVLCKSTLVNIVARGRYFETVLADAFRQQSHRLPKPPSGWFAYVAFHLSGNGWQQYAAQNLCNALAEETSLTETHPSLLDRLTAMSREDRGAVGSTAPEGPTVRGLVDGLVSEDRLKEIGEIVIPKVLTPSAATHYLQGHYNTVVQQLESEFLSRIAPQWKWQHEKSRSMQRCLQRLEAKSPEELTNWQRGTLAATVHALAGFPQAKAMLIAASQLPDTNPVALLHLGTALINADRPEGEAILQRAMDTDLELIDTAVPIIAAYYKRRNALDKAVEVQAFQHRWANEVNRQRRLWSVVRPSDKLRRLVFPEEINVYLAEDAHWFSEIIAIAVNEKAIEQQPNSWYPQVVVIFHHKVSAEGMARVCTLLSSSIPFFQSTRVVACSIEASGLLNRIRANSSIVYTRGG